MATRSKMCVRSRSLAGIAASNPTRNIVVFAVELCFVRERSLRRADHSPRGFSLTMMRGSRDRINVDNEKTLAHWGLLSHGEKKEAELLRGQCAVFA